MTTVARLLALDPETRRRVILMALDAAHRRVYGSPLPGEEPYAPDPRHRPEPRRQDLLGRMAA